jgi:hypothetical protein
MAFGALSVATAWRMAGFADRGDYAALTTLFERMQRVQTRMRRTAPSTSALTRCRFGSNRRALTLWAWLILRPTTGAFPQISQVLAMA